MNDMSLADIAAVTRNNDGYGDGFNSWIWIIIFVIWGAWGGRGFGGNGGSDGSAVTEAGLCNAMNFQELANSVGRLSDNQALQFTQLTNGVCNLGYELQSLNNATNVNMLQGFNAIQQVIDNCCCTTQRAIDSVNYNGAINTNTIVSAVKDSTQAILSQMCEDKMAAKDGIIADLKNQVALNGLAESFNSKFCAIESVLGRIPTYPNGITYTAGPSPFWNQACCGQFAGSI